MSKPHLLSYAIGGTQPMLGTNDIKNPEYYCTIYVCAASLREMANLVKVHMPNETLTATDFALRAVKEWPRVMRYVKKEPGVWAVRHAGSFMIYRMEKGVPREID